MGDQYMAQGRLTLGDRTLCQPRFFVRRGFDSTTGADRYER